MDRFDGKVVAITGAAGGIGQALCRFFGERGAAIAALDKSERVHEVAEALGRDGIRAAAAVCDIVDTAAVAAGFAHLSAALGPIDVLINNAGGTRRSNLEQTTPEDWRADVDFNVTGAYACTYAVLPDMKRRRAGAIVSISSVNGLASLGDPAYSAGKAAMISMTRSLALEYGRFGIRANVICPGTVRTPAWEKRAARDPEVLTRLQRWYPLGRVAEPIDIARAAGFLASDAASAITGVTLPVDCGLMAGNIVMSRELTLEEF